MIVPDHVVGGEASVVRPEERRAGEGSAPRRIVLTGAAGNLGQVLRTHFARRGQDLTVSDRAPLEDPFPGERVLCGDLTDPAFVARLLENTDAVVHLAGVASNRPLEELLGPNFLAVGNLYRAARERGVRRILLASSNHVTGMFEVGAPLTGTEAVRPDSHYGASKAWAEAVARMYWDKHGIETLALRIGSCLARPRSVRHLSTWLSHEDLCRLVDAGLAAPPLGYRVVYGVSANRQRWWGNENDSIAMAVADRAEEHSSASPHALPQLPTDVRWQGGEYAEAGIGE